MSNKQNDDLLERLYQTGLEQGLSEDNAADFATDAFEALPDAPEEAPENICPNCAGEMRLFHQNTAWDGVEGPRNDESFWVCPFCDK
jgi:uncharacterized protein with PIN domain